MMKNLSTEELERQAQMLSDPTVRKGKTSAYIIHEGDSVMIRCPECSVPLNIHNSRVNLTNHLSAYHHLPSRGFKVTLHFVRGEPATFSVVTSAPYSKGNLRRVKTGSLIAAGRPEIHDLSSQPSVLRSRAKVKTQPPGYRPLGIPLVPKSETS